MIKLCIFDLDGTLLDTLGTVRERINRALKTEGIAPVSTPECAALLGGSIGEIFEKLLVGRGCFDEGLLRRLIGAFSRAYAEDPIGTTAPYGGICELLCVLEARGIRTAVFSNKADDAAHTLTYHFFPGIDYVLGHREGIRKKPSPEGIFHILSHFGLSPDEALYVGDTEVDVDTGHAAGVRTLGACWGYRTLDALSLYGAQNTVTLPEQILSYVD